jgi:hypothetical protein
VAELTDWQRGQRIALNFFFMVIANCGLIYLHQLAGQFGVIGSNSDVLVDNDDADDDGEGDKSKEKNKKYTPPEILSERSNINSHKETLEMMTMSSIFPQQDDSSSLQESEEVPTLSKPPLLFSLLRVSEEKTISFPRLNLLKSRMSLSQKTERQVKIFFTFVFVTMFWSVIWDMFSSLPREYLIDEDDDHGTPVTL